MLEEEKQDLVDIDTSGPDVDVQLEEPKEQKVEVEEINKQIEKIANAKEKLGVLDEFEPEKGTTL